MRRGREKGRENRGESTGNRKDSEGMFRRKDRGR